MRLRGVIGGLGLLVGALAAPSPSGAGGSGHRGGASPAQAVLEARATLSADFLAPGPPSGAGATPANGRIGPFPGQVIPGFSGVVDNGHGAFWAMPDNGFGAKGNSADFLLRLYLVRPKWETSRGGPGEIRVDSFLPLSDPHHQVPFPIVNESTSERLLTGGDFDIESVVRSDDGSFWIGEEFGPFLLHFGADGELLAPPVPFVAGKSPQNPTLAPGEVPRVRQSRGFEAMARSQTGRFLYPIVEGSFTDDPLPRRRFVYEFDTHASAYTGRTWQYRTDADPWVIGDAVMISGARMIVIERDDFEGPRSVTKKLYVVDLDRTDAQGFVKKQLLVDLLYIHNPKGIGNGRPDGAFGLGDPFSFPLQSVESLAVLHDGRLLIANDNNYPGSNGREPGTPDDTEMIVLSLGGKARERAARGALVIGHRGASGYRPEHTLAAYELAIRQCADFIEPDLVSTKDGVLVARHENEISGTTDVANHPEFASRNTTKSIDGVSITGWFTEDFTLAELKTLRAIERIPSIRPANASFDGLFDVPTLQEVIELAKTHRSCKGRSVGIYPETKHPTYFDSIGLSLEEPLVRMLDDNGYDGRRGAAFIQSFEVANLQQLSGMTRVPLVQLINCTGKPFDFVASGDPRSYADLATPAGLAGISAYASGIGVCKDLMIPRDASGNLTAPTPVIGDAHAQRLIVHGWTFRAENTFLPAGLRSSAVPTEYGDLAGELAEFIGAGMDGFFTDQPDRGVAAAEPFED